MKLRSFLLAGAAALAGHGAAYAQALAPAPVRETVDGNGVDLFRGRLMVAETLLSLGGGGNEGLSYRRITRGSATTTTLDTFITKSGSTVLVQVAGYADRFTQSGSSYFPTEGTGATLSLSGSTYTYVARDGTVVTFSKYASNESVLSQYNSGNEGYATAIVQPDGERLTFSYDAPFYCEEYGGGGDLCVSSKRVRRLASAKNAAGYILSVSYAESGLPEPSTILGWLARTGVKAVNRAVEACDGSDCATTLAWPSVGAVSGNAYAVPTNGYAIGADGITGIYRPGDASPRTTIGYAGGKVQQVAGANGTDSYGYADDAGLGERTVTVTDALAHATAYVFDIASERLKRVTDALGRTTSYTYDGSGRLTRTTLPEGNYVNLSYDGRGNVTATRAVAKPGSGAADIVASAVYPASCTNAATCNQPTSTTDARGGVTDYTYASHGGVLTVTLPAPTPGAARPQTRYSYATAQAQVKNAGGSIVGSGNNVTLLTQVSACASGSSCTGGANETVQAIGYAGSGVANNLQPVSVTVQAGDGSVVATNALSYDPIGNLAAVDGPLAGSDDTTSYRYDIHRRQVGVISPDPDGAGALKRRAQRTTFDTAGLAVRAEVGTVNGTSDADWAGFTTLQQVDVVNDATGRPVRQVLGAGGTTYAVSELSYDAGGRPECSAQRLNPAAWSLATNACTAQAAGSAGPDRIVKTSYTAADEVAKVQSAYGVSGTQADEVTTTYSQNGKAATLTDAEANTTSYAYDGHDRLYRTWYPVATKGAGVSSTTDYEQLGYDAAGNVTSRRLRDAQTVYYGYDALNRTTSVDRPNVAGWESDTSFGYDNLGRLTSAGDAIGQVLTFGYDALGRRLSETSNWYGAITSQYDAGGRRTRLTWFDGFYVGYDHLVTGEVKTIRENGASSGVGVLATFGYDDLGQRTSLVRGNGTTTSYTPDAVSRLAALAHDLAGTTSDVTTTLSYNPAGQIASLTRSNDAYANANANQTTGYTVNGLNQATAAGSASVGYDASGNVTSIGSATFGYTVDNLLTTAPGSTNYGYDPLGRLWHETVPSSILLYDGQALVTERDATSGTVRRRYVHGPGVDEPLVWYEGSGTSNRKWLHADERGSIVAVSDDTGAKTAINSYDEYGKPASGNVGRFQYAGQAWLPEVGLYYYKARMYSPALGRFMQTDPIGYGDGMNLYGYVGGDPVNAVDPEGTYIVGRPGGGLYPCEMDGNCGPSFLMPQYAYADVVVTGRRRDSSSTPVRPISRTVVPLNLGSINTGGLAVGAAGSQNDQTPQPGDIVVKGRRLPHPRVADRRWPVSMQPNGCTGVSDVFKQSCNVHDICYVTPGVARQICDRQFYFNMLVERPDRKGLALDYYIGVINIGDRFYKNGQRLGRDFQRRYGR